MAVQCSFSFILTGERSEADMKSKMYIQLSF